MSVGFFPARVYNIMLSTSLRQVTSHLIQYKTPKPFQSPTVYASSAHWIQMVLPLSGLRDSTVSSPKVEKNCSISFCNMSFLFSASSLARSALRILISTIVNFFRSWSSSSCRAIISVSRVRFLCSKLQREEIKADSSWAALLTHSSRNAHHRLTQTCVFSFTKLRLKLWFADTPLKNSSMKCLHRATPSIAHLENAQ